MFIAVINTKHKGVSNITCPWCKKTMTYTNDAKGKKNWNKHRNKCVADKTGWTITKVMREV